MSCQDESEYNDLLKEFPFDDTEIHGTKVLIHRIIKFILSLTVAFKLKFRPLSLPAASDSI